MILAGLDPGLSGAIAFLDTATGAVTTHDMPTLRMTRGGKSKGEVDPHALADLFWSAHCGHAFVEQVGAMPGQGVSSVFAFGDGFGIVKGVLATAGVPYTLVAPRRWKSALGVPASKDGARARASQLMPAAASQWPRVKDDGRAEAALLAMFGMRSFQAIAGQPAEARAAK